MILSTGQTDGAGVNLHINLGNLPMRQRGARPQESQNHLDIIQRMLRLGRNSLTSLEVQWQAEAEFVTAKVEIVF